MKITARMSIGRMHGGYDTERCIKVAIEDKASGVLFFEARMTLADLASALTGSSYVEIEADVRALDKKRLEGEK